MKDLSKYGFRSQRAFQMAPSISLEIFERMARDKDWHKAKTVLYRKDCPADIRERFASSSVWYMRLTAMLAGGMHSEFLKRAKIDPDPRVRRAYKNKLIFFAQDVLSLREKLCSDKKPLL